MGEETSSGAYPQMPYEKITDEEYDKMVSKIKPLDLSSLYQYGKEAEGEKFCSNDTCTI